MGINFKLSLESIIILLILIMLFLPPFFGGGNNDFVLALMCFLLGIILILLSYDSTLRKTIKAFKLSPILLISSSFIFFFLITNFFSVAPYFSWFYFLEILVYFLIFFIISFLSLSEKIFRIFSFILMGEGLVLSLIGIYFYEAGFGGIIASTFYNPNAFAGYLIFSLPFILYFLMESNNRKEEIIFLLLSVILFSVFVLTGSRGAFISFVPVFVLLIALFLKREKQKKEILKKLVILFIGCFILLNFLIYLKEGEISFFSALKSVPVSSNHMESSLSDRFDFWKGAISMFKERPVLGWGLSSFSTIYPRYQPSVMSYAEYTHNYYLAILGETGIFGAITFYVFIFYLIYLGFKNFKSVWLGILDGKRGILISVFFLSILGSMIHSGLDFDWSFRANFLTFFVLSGLFLNLNYKIARDSNQKEKNNAEKKMFFTPYLLFVLGLIFILISLLLFYSFYYFKQGEKLEIKGDYSSAILAYNKGTRINPNPDFLIKEGIILFLKGDIEQSEEVVEKLKKLSPEDKEVWFLSGKIKIAKQNPDAEDDFKKSISVSPYFIDGYIELSRLYLKQGKIDKSLNVLDEAIEKIDENSIQYFKDQCENQSLFEEPQLKNTVGCLNILNGIADLYAEKSRIENIRNNNKEAEKFFQKAEEIRNYLEIH